MMHTPSQCTVRFCALVLLTIALIATFIGCDRSAVHYSHKGGSAHPGATPVAGEASPSDSPALSEELWVIARPEGVDSLQSSPQSVSSARPAPTPTAQADYATIETDTNQPLPGTGCMITQLPGETKSIPLPLKHTAVSASVSAYIATVDVQQQFHNPFDTKIEAIYVFPLPQNAAVNEFIMTIGDRRIRGIIRERAEAEKIYNDARAQGHVASLLAQERPNIFTQKVANIEPGKQIDVNIKYFNTLAYDDGWYEFVFPMVVGPRFNPQGYTDGIGAVGRGDQGRSGQSTEIQYLAPIERSSHDIALKLSIDAGVAVEAHRSINHKINLTQPTTSQLLVSLDDSDTIPNKDFVFRWKVVGQRIKTNVLTHTDHRGSFFTLMLYPPEDLNDLSRSPMEMIFVLDCSGSMNGKPIEQAKSAIIHSLRQLQPGDTFQVIRFSNDASQFGADPVPATPQMVNKAVRYVNQLDGEGGTQMIEGIKAALDFPHDSDRLRLVSFMTDGYIGNDREILGEVKQRVGESRIFSFGVGSAPNRYLMDRMAKLGRGAVAYLSLKDNGEEVMDRFFNRISHPALTDIQLDFGSAHVRDVFPAAIPDLFVGRPVVITGRFTGSLDDAIRVTGKAGGKTLNIVIPTGHNVQTHPALPSVWARTQIAEIYDQLTFNDDPKLADQIRDLALEYQLMSAFTAFVAVDSLNTTAGSQGVSVHQAIPVPDGVRYETTVTD